MVICSTACNLSLQSHHNVIPLGEVSEIVVIWVAVGVGSGGGGGSPKGRRKSGSK